MRTHYEAFLVNPMPRAGVNPDTARRAEVKKETKQMKKRKLAGAALAAHRAKVSRMKGRRNAPLTDRKNLGKKVKLAHGKKIKSRIRHIVKTYSRHGGAVTGYQRKGGRVGSHISNPVRRYRKHKRNPPFGLTPMMEDMRDGLIGAAVILGTLWVAGFVNRQVQKAPVLAVGWANVAAKLAVALGLGYGASLLLTRQRKLVPVVYAAAFTPALLSAVSQFAPALAAQASLAGDMGAQLEMQIGGLQPTRTSDNYLSAQLREEESDSSSF